MFETRHERLLTTAEFAIRVARYAGFALGIVAVALGGGVIGYHVTENLPWVDALVNAAMILGGMGPVNQLHTTAGKVFASAYALFSGLIFIAIAGVLFAPFFHRFLHRFHIEPESHEPPPDPT